MARRRTCGFPRTLHSARFHIAITLGILLTGCSKEPVDPIEYVKSLIPKIQDGLNRRDIAGLKKLGTSQFEPNRFITDVFTHGVEGDVALSLVRIRHVTGEVALNLNAAFGPNGRGGLKELKIQFVGSEEDGDWKITTYILLDRSLPAPKPVPDSPASPQDTANPS
ncbi:MAG: hypothetical protein AB1752_00585 [Candidatus Zixiibacteriota bacterium]